MDSKKPPVLHIVVIGFHHKKGCQVEFSYPPLITGTEGKHECPSGWKYLPTLGLPDGSHNFAEDTVFFNLPSLTDPTETIYGVSCYRQIPVEQLKIRTADVTRSTVQKSVCILSRLPIYGYIEVKLALIADAFFEQGDFSCTGILVKAYHQLNACLMDECRPLRHFYVGLPLREIMLKWRHKVLILFKLFLLQKRVVCFSSPVHPMCNLILGISSLIPRLLEKGFQEVACVRTSRPMSPMPNFTSSELDENHTENKESSPETSKESSIVSYLDNEGIVEENVNEIDCAPKEKTQASEIPKLIRADSNGTEVGKQFDRSNSLTREVSVDTLASTLLPFSSINPDLYRAPISIFTSGHLCLPYLSLPYMDLLTDPSVLSYVIGTSNVLFQQKKNLADILVDIENCTIDTTDQELRKQLTLTTEDLRFVDYILRHVQNPKEDAEGSENWIREQFQGYALALLKTAVMTFSSSNATTEITKDCDHFNSHFMCYFKKTQCFQEWYDVKPDDQFFNSLPNGHPFAGTLSVADMKLKIAQTMQNSESGRKINQAVNTTSRAVGGAISQAKGALTNWWSSMTTTPVLPNSPSNSATFQSDEIENFNYDAKDLNTLEFSEDDEEIHKVEVKGVCDDADNIVEEKEDITPQESVKEVGVIEIAKEAELLDSKNEKQNGDIFIV